MSIADLRSAVLCACAMALAACGGGSSGPPPGPDPDPGPQQPPPVASQKGIEGVGVVASFGNSFNSIKVGGREYDATAAQVTVDDQPAVVSDLRLGNVVAVVATTDDDGVTATATSIRQINDLEGTIDAGSIDLAAGTFSVLGQAVRVVATTLFDDDIMPSSLEGLAAGDAVEVSVLAVSNGVYTATRIDLDDDAGDFELTGIVSDLDAAALAFNIGPLRVDYAQATLDGFAGGAISDGDRVEVEGSALGAGGELIADEVSNENDDFDGDDGDFAGLEGLITRFASATDFDVDQRRVTTTADTVYDDGAVTDLAEGVRVEVEGVLDANGVLVATEVDFEDAADASNTEVFAAVESVDPAASTIAVLGQTLTVSADAILEDDTDADLVPFTLADLNVGDFVELTVLRTETTAEVIVLAREDADDDSYVAAPVDAVARPQLTVFAVTVETTPQTSYRDQADNPLTADAFFGAVQSGTLVKAKGAWNGTALIADEVEFDDN